VVTRNRTLDVLRVIFALMVLYSHAFELRTVDLHHEIFEDIDMHLTWGMVGVDGFFLLSGCLIVESWRRTPNLLEFLRKRVLRIVPGYLVAVLLSVVIIGLIAPVGPDFFHHFGPHFPISVLTLYAPLAPDVFPGLSNHSVNGSLWTITYEFRCYLLVALMGVTALLRRRIAWLLLTIFLFVVSVSPALAARLTWTGRLLITGDPKFYYRLVPIFLIGGCFALFRKEIPFRPWLATFSFGLMLVTARFGEPFFALFFGYVLFYLASLRLPVFQSARQMPDISYGLYLYGWPVECSVMYFMHTPPLVTFAVAALLSAIFGWLSWHFVERPFLKLKTGGRGELAAA
jgi:peptidoglycan/LPS O-acetylase OafA/YrhL